MIGVRNMIRERDVRLLERSRAMRLANAKKEDYEFQVWRIERRLGLR